MRHALSICLLCSLTAAAAPAGGDLSPDLGLAARTPVDADGVWRPVVTAPALDPQQVQDLLEDLATRSPDHAVYIDPWIDGPDGLVRLDDLMPAAPPVPDKQSSPPPMPADLPGATDGALSGKAVYLSQCHGYIWFDTLGRFSTQRGNNFDTVEDFHNPEGMNHFLTAYLENAGASVFAAKERDHNTSSVIVDNNDPDAYEEIGSGFSNGARGWGDQPAWGHGDNPFQTGGTRKAPANGGAVFRWTVDVPEDGFYVVYVSWDSDPGNTPEAHYRIHHPGGSIDRYYDQRVHGSTWQYTERLWLTAGSPLIVELIGDSRDSGTISADAVRIGGGIGRIERHRKTTGRPRWEEGAILSTQFNGAPPSVYDPYSDGDNGSDPPARSRWAAWEHPRGEDALYLSWHSNATADGSARGTVTYIYEGNAGAATAGSEDFAWAVQEELVDSFQQLWEPAWTDRGVKRAAFAEVNPSHNDEMPSILVELAFHDNATDSSYLKHPRFRLDAARAMYRGIVRSFHERSGAPLVYLPEPPVGLSVTQDPAGLAVSWQPGQTGAPFGDAPTGYVVQTSPDGRIWDDGFAVSGTSTVVSAPAGRLVFVRVVATNPGGSSFPSEIAGGVRSPDGRAPVLIVDAFDRFETGQLEWDDLGGDLGRVRRMDPLRINANDIVVPHGQAVRGAGWTFDSISDERLGDVDLADYRIVIWATGEESTVDEAISSAQQRTLQAAWSAGTSLWVSGAEVLWDLDEKGSSTDKAFASTVLGATLANDDGNSEVAYGAGLLDGLTLDFSADRGPYPVEWPDVLASQRPVVARYGSAQGDVAGVLGDRVLTLGFPFDAVFDPGVRTDVARRVLPALAPDYVPPELVDDPIDDPDDDPLTEGPDRERIEGRGCGCSSTGATASWWLLPLLLVVGRRRR